MAKPRVFVSSTYFDLKHIRASLDMFISSLGFESILSEKGNIAYLSDDHLDTSCYREAQNSDIFVLIVGGRYGSERSGEKMRDPDDFFARYDSITRKEYDTAADLGIPIYVLVEKGVHAEYQTYLKNKASTLITYAHVENVNVFLLIDDILSKQKNNPLHTFEKYDEIEDWLKEQWAGFFRELLRKQSQNKQLAGLSAQVAQLKETNETLKKYLESLMLAANPEKSTVLIEEEKERLQSLQFSDVVSSSDYVRYVSRKTMASAFDVATAIRDSNSVEDLISRINRLSQENGKIFDIAGSLKRSVHAKQAVNEVRSKLGVKPLEELFTDTSPE